jgi:hypothetical protein
MQETSDFIPSILRSTKVSSHDEHESNDRNIDDSPVTPYLKHEDGNATSDSTRGCIADLTIYYKVRICYLL